MSIQIDTDALKALSVPLPLYSSTHIGSLEGTDGRVYAIVCGADQSVAEQLRSHALDESDTELQQFTNDRKRFGEKSFESWYAKDRLPFCLLDEDHLAAFAWYGPEALPADVILESVLWHTAGFRSFAPYRGKGLATPFFNASLEVHKIIFPDNPVWIQTNEDNGAGRHVFKKIGFEEYGKSEINGRITLIHR